MSNKDDFVTSVRELEALEQRFKTTGVGQRPLAESPVVLSVFENGSADFVLPPAVYRPEDIEAVGRCFRAARELRDSGKIYDDKGHISETAIIEMAKVGFWGALLPKEFGGLSLPFSLYSKMALDMAAEGLGSLAGLANISQEIGVGGPLTTPGVRTYGQTVRGRYLRKLAAGTHISGFALTEPGAGSDVRAITTTATIEGGQLVLNGTKLFISGIRYSTAAITYCLTVAVKFDGAIKLVIVDVPSAPSEHFKLEDSGTLALPNIPNSRIEFFDFRVPLGNLIFLDTPFYDDGEGILYHQLNRGRIGVAMTAIGSMVHLLGELPTWAKYRETYGRPICEHQLVLVKMGKVACKAVGLKVLADWGARIVELGHGAELEAIVPKRLASDYLVKHLTNEVVAVWGGRALNIGMLPAESVIPSLVTQIYEGENGVLALKFFQTLLKGYNAEVFKPLVERIVTLIEKDEIESFNPASPSHLFKARRELFVVVRSVARRLFQLLYRDALSLLGLRYPEYNTLPAQFRKYAVWAGRELEWHSVYIGVAMMKLQEKMPDEQASLAEWSHKLQLLLALLVVACNARHLENEVERKAAELFCRELAVEIRGNRTSVSFLDLLSNKQVNRNHGLAELGRKVVSGEFPMTANTPAPTIPHPYK